MKKAFLIAVCGLWMLPAFGQPINNQTPEIMLEIADSQFLKKDYYNALEWYEKYYDEDQDIQISYKIAELEYLLRDYRAAERSYRRVIRKVDRLKERKKRRPNTEVPDFPNIRYRYAQVLKMNEDYDEAIKEFQTFINDEAEDPALVRRAKTEIAGCELAISSDVVSGLEIIELDDLNTKFSDFSPRMTPEGELYYAAIPSEEVIIIKDEEQGDHYSKIYRAVKQDEEWAAGTPLDLKINREDFHTGNVAFSRDGNIMFFTRSKLQGNILKESKIYFSRRSGAGWSAANEVEGVNGDYLAMHPMPGELFGDEVLFFVSDMPGGQGGLDIFYAPIRGEGIYGEPSNLGKTINSYGDEVTPFYQDGRLFFSSDGHAGVGGLDIFESTWDGAKWSTPRNMGVGYNSSVDDFYFVRDEEGYNGFLVSNRPGGKYIKSRTCCDDIYAFKRAKITADVNVLVFDSETKQGLRGVTVQLIELEGEEAGETKSKTNNQDNKFNFALNLNKSYNVIGTGSVYLPDSAQFNTVGLRESKTFELKLFLKPPPEPEYDTITVTINEPIRLNNIYYDFDKWNILPDAEQDLQVLLDLLKEYPEMVIELSSHTDARGNRVYNQNLSQKRAQSATDWLVERGIDKDRIKAVGYGESKILNRCKNNVDCTEEEHRFNRRTEFTILEGPTTITIKQTKVKKRGEEEEEEE